MTKDIDSIIGYIENQLCDTSRTYEWDNNGLQIRLANRKVDKIGVALDPSILVIDEAIRKGCELLITHHPLFFGKIKNISCDDSLGKKIIKAIQNNLSIYSYHTNLDLSDYSLNDYLADKLEFEVISYLERFGAKRYFKYVVFVPRGYEHAIYDAFDRAGAGFIGNYSSVSFSSEGTGRFKPLEGADPFIGRPGEVEEVKEFKIETIVDEKRLGKLIREVLSVHPYEEVAYDVYPVKFEKEFGLGRICRLKSPMHLEELIKYICEKLGEKSIRVNGKFDFLVDKIAIVTGSGVSCWKICRDLGIKVLLTGDMKHHDAIDAFENGVAILDAGHYQTERIFMEYVCKSLKKAFDGEIMLINENRSIIEFTL